MSEYEVINAFSKLFRPTYKATCQLVAMSYDNHKHTGDFSDSSKPVLETSTMSRTMKGLNDGIKKQCTSASESLLPMLLIKATAPNRIHVFGCNNNGAVVLQISNNLLLRKIPKSHNDAKQLSAFSTTNSSPSLKIRHVSYALMSSLTRASYRKFQAAIRKAR